MITIDDMAACYHENESFREYVDKFCFKKNCTIMTAFKCKVVIDYYESMQPGECNNPTIAE